MKYNTRKAREHSERQRQRANRRWAKDRTARAFLQSLDPIKLPGKVVRRIVVIDNEITAREIVFYSFDRYIDRKRKLAAVRALALPEVVVYHKPS